MHFDSGVLVGTTLLYMPMGSDGFEVLLHSSRFGVRVSFGSLHR